MCTITRWPLELQVEQETNTDEKELLYQHDWLDSSKSVLNTNELTDSDLVQILYINLYFVMNQTLEKM